MEDITTTPAVEREVETDQAQLAGQAAKATKDAGGRAGIIRRFSKTELQLSKPFVWCGKTWEKVDLDFEALTGVDMEAIDDELNAMGIRGGPPADNRRYQRMLAARAGGLPADAIEHMPLADYNAIVNAARYFLIVTG